MITAVALSTLVAAGASGCEPPCSTVQSNWSMLAGAVPRERAGHVMAYHEQSQRIVLATGANRTGYFSETWTWDGNAWTLEPVAGPPMRTHAAMVYDRARGVLVLFGGRITFIGSQPVPYGDTWEWDGATWTEVSPLNSPPARIAHAMAYDEARGVTVLFGGGSRATGLLGDTWEYDGATWTQVASTGPSARESTSMAYIPHAARTVLFSGWAMPNDTWEWDGNEWTQVTTSGAPEPRWGCAMAYDPTLAVVVMFGGENGPALFGDTWHYRDGEWCCAATSGPAARHGATMDYHPVTNGLVLYGGYTPRTDDYLDDTWLAVATDRDCPCDFGGIGGVNIFDLLAYLDLWFGLNVAADVDGVDGVTRADLLAFLDCWFPASAGGPCP